MNCISQMVVDEEIMPLRPWENMLTCTLCYTAKYAACIWGAQALVVISGSHNILYESTKQKKPLLNKFQSLTQHNSIVSMSTCEFTRALT